MVTYRTTACAFTLLLLMIGSHLSLQAQHVRATASVDADTVLIGDWIPLHVEIAHPGDISVLWPMFSDSLGGFEIVTLSAPSIQKMASTVVESCTIVLTTFDSGTHVVPSISFEYTLPGNTKKQFAKTLPIPVVVDSISIDTTQDIKDIKPPLSVPISLAEILPYLIGIVGIGGLAWLMYYVLRKRRKGERIFPQPSPRPAHEVALESLRALDAERLWQRGKVKEYHSQLSDIIRIYIERRFHVMAMELTTDEILRSPAISSLGNDVQERLKEILIRADLVKFAKFQPLPQEHETSLALAISFVESTRLRPEMVKQEIVQELKA